MKINKRQIGSEYENVAANYLKENGYDIIELNYRCKIGEVDIVAKDKCDLVFVEVKYRKNLMYGSPFEAVDYKKQSIIKKTACCYMMENNISENTYIRFDVIGICGQNITLIKNAFGGF